MTYDEIELDALSSLDRLQVAAIRPRLFAPFFSTSALSDEQLRSQLAHEIEANAAQIANQRTRIFFQKNAELPTSSRRQELENRLRELDEELALQRLRYQWIETAATMDGREKLLTVEATPILTAQSRASWVKITLGLQRGFDGETHSLAEVEAFVAGFLARENQAWGVSISPTRLVYGGANGGGREDGVEVGLINDPRAPIAPDALRRRALGLADALRQGFGQVRLCLIFPDEIVMLEAPKEPSSSELSGDIEGERSYE